MPTTKAYLTKRLPRMIHLKTKSYRFIREEIEAFIKAQRIAPKGEEPGMQHPKLHLPRQPSR
jgi:hypothetical protein